MGFFCNLTDDFKVKMILLIILLRSSELVYFYIMKIMNTFYYGLVIEKLKEFILCSYTFKKVIFNC